MKHPLLNIIAGILACLTGAETLSNEAVAAEIVRVGAYTPAQSIGVSKIIKPWAEAVAAEAGDAIEVKTYWGGGLGKNPHKQYELVKHGVLDVAWVLPAYVAGQFPEMSLFELPFLFETSEEASLVGWRLYEQGLFTGFSDIHVIGFFTTEPNGLFMKKPIPSLDSLAGAKIRSLGPVQAQWLSLFDASAQSLSAADMNQALNKGTIDGAIQGWTGMRTFGTFQLVDQAYAVPVGTIPFLLVMNKKKWNALPSEVQEIMTKHGGETLARNASSAYSMTTGQIKSDLAHSNSVIISASSANERNSYRTRSEAIHEWWIARTPNGRVIYDAALRELEIIRREKHD